VTAATACVLGFASTALASTSGAEAQSTARPADLIPDASWNGRPIKRPDPSPLQVSRPAASTLVRQGAGFRQTGGSDAVRDIQRRLRALGYRPGPVDGMFGPRTHSSVAWFQIKHRLPVTGAVDGTTLDILRFRTRALPAAAVPVAIAPPLRPEAAVTATAQPPIAHGDPTPAVVRLPHLAPVPRPEPAATAAKRPAHHESSAALVMLLAGLALALIAIAALSTWLRSGARLPDRAQLRKVVPTRTRAQAKRVPARPSASRRGRPSNGAVADNPAGQAIGYAVGRSDRDFARQKRAMERICGERGWTLSALVKERDAGGRKQRRKPGLAHVLKQLSAGGASQLIVGRLQSLARTPADLAVLLEWCAKRGVGVVALDVGLDTTTADGRLAARCLGRVGAPPARPQQKTGNGNGHARTSGVR
jgi:peptidoglycan hydrolase-like protein with peptidoglycan-binding domain